MPKLSLMGDAIGALLTWSNVKLSLATTELQGRSGECAFKEAAAERNLQRSQTCTGGTENDSQSLGLSRELRSLFKLPSPRKLFCRNVQGVCQSADTSAHPSERAFPVEERFFANSDVGPVLESSVFPDLAYNWYDAIDSHLISLTSLDDDYSSNDTDESYGHAGPSMAELMKEVLYQQEHPDDCFLETNFPAHDFYEMVSDLYTTSDRAKSSPPAIESDHSLAFLLRNMQ